MARRRAIAVTGPSRFPTEFIFRLFRAVLILAFFFGLVLAGVGGFLTYRIVTAHNDRENVTPSSYLLSNYETVSFKDSAGSDHEGWLLIGLKGAPVILLCHGYNSNRSELLPLGIALRENHFNVYLFNFQPATGNRPFGDLGARQVGQLLAAITAITKQPDVNPRRAGLFGVNTGGYAALIAAQQSALVKALVVDDPYEYPDQMFDAQMDRFVGGSSPVFRVLARTEFHLLTRAARAPRLSQDFWKLENVPKLFVLGRDTPSLAAATKALYGLASQPKRLLVLEHSQAALASEVEKKEYENQVLNFFLQNLRLRPD